MPVVGVLLPRRTHLSRTFFMSYSDKLKSPKWQKLRLKVFERDEWICKYCKDTENQLHVHHLKYTAKEPYQEPMENLVTVCDFCHFILEYTKLINKGDTYIGELIGIDKRTLCRVAFYKAHIIVFTLDREILISSPAQFYYDTIERHKIFLNDVNT